MVGNDCNNYCGGRIIIHSTKNTKINAFQLTMTLVDKSKPLIVKDKARPKGIKLKPKELWCPYCSMPVVFVKNKQLGVRCCPVCGVSINEFYVKKVNR